MANGRRQIPPLRGYTAAVLGALALFVISAGAGMLSWSIVALGVAMMILAVSMVVVSSMRGGARAYVAGTAHVVSVSEPPAASLYGRCELHLVVDAPGMTPAAVKVRDPRVPVAKWPDAGMSLPITVAVDDPRRVRIQWDDVPTHAEAAAEDQFIGEYTEDYSEEYPPYVPHGRPAAGDTATGDAATNNTAAGATATRDAATADLTDDLIGDLTGQPAPGEPAAKTPGRNRPAAEDPPAPDEQPAAKPAAERLAGEAAGGIPRPRPSPHPSPRSRPRPGSPPAPRPAPPEEQTGGPSVTAIEFDLGGVVTEQSAARPDPAGDQNEITVRVNDLARSAAFYRDVLGLQEVARNGDEGLGGAAAVLVAGDTRLVLRQAGDAPMTDEDRGRIDMEVGDVHVAYEELKAKGARFTHGPRPAGSAGGQELWVAELHDPDGHPIAIVQRRGGS